MGGCEISGLHIFHIKAVAAVVGAKKWAVLLSNKWQNDYVYAVWISLSYLDNDGKNFVMIRW